MISLATADSVLKSFFLGVLANELNTSVNPLLARMEQTTSDVWGKEIRKIAFNGIYGGIGAGTEVGDLPNASNSSYIQLVLPLKNLYGSIDISDKALRASQHSDGAFVNLLESEMDALLRASKYNFSRMLFGDGTGTLCKVTSASNLDFYVDDVTNVMEGMLIDVVSGTTKTPVVTSRLIAAIDRKNKKVSVAGSSISAGTVSAGDIITVQGSYNNEITGLGAIFGDSAKLYNVARSGRKWMQPHKVTSAKLDDITIQTAIDTVDEVAGSTVDFIVCSSGVKRAYQDYLVNNRTNIDVMHLQGGYKAISYNGIPVVSDRFCPAGTMYILNTNDFHMHQLCDWRWLEDDSGRILKQIPGRPVYNATLVKYCDIMCDRPLGQAMISGITEA